MPQTIKSQIARLERALQKLKARVESQERESWNAHHVSGNVTLRAFLLAAGLNLPKSKRKLLGSPLFVQSQKTNTPIGLVKCKRVRTVGGIPYSGGPETINTYAPHVIAAVLIAKGFAVEVPSPSALLNAEQTLAHHLQELKGN